MVSTREPLSPPAYSDHAAHRAETDLLLRCARASTAEDNARIRDLVAGGLDWAYVLWIGQRQGMLPRLYQHLQASAPDLVPTRVIDQIREHHEGNARRVRAARDEVRHLLDVLNREGIPVMPLRASSLMILLGGDAAERPVEPLDILVPKRDIARARTALIHEGYTPVHRLTRAQEATLQRSRALILHHHDRGIRLHLHQRIAPSYVPVRLSPASLWRGRTEGVVEGMTLRCPSFEDLLLLLCMDGAVQMWERLVWVSDLARLIEHCGPIDWPLLLQRARRSRAERMLLLGLFVAQDLLGSAIPSEVRKRVAAEPAVVALGGQVRRRLLHDMRGRTGERERLRFRLHLLERSVDRIRYCARFALTSTIEDWNTLPLPDPLFPAYRIARPVRLAATIARGAARRQAPYMQSPMPVVQRMLAVAEVGPSDVVYDLGCGDGRIVIAAAQRYGARGVGIDLDPERIAESRANARTAGVEHLVSFIQADAMAVDLRPATVVTLWMLQTLNLSLRPKLEAQLAPGTRIVGHSFDMGDWGPARTELVPYADEYAVVYLWVTDRSTPEMRNPQQPVRAWSPYAARVAAGE